MIYVLYLAFYESGQTMLDSTTPHVKSFTQSLRVIDLKSFHLPFVFTLPQVYNTVLTVTDLEKKIARSKPFFLDSTKYSDKYKSCLSAINCAPSITCQNCNAFQQTFSHIVSVIRFILSKPRIKGYVKLASLNEMCTVIFSECERPILLVRAKARSCSKPQFVCM